MSDSVQQATEGSEDRQAPLLDAEAIAQHPVWRFLLDGESTDPAADESCVRPTNTPPGRGDYASYLLAARYTLDDGTQLPGLVQVDILGQRVDTTPCAILIGQRQIDPLDKTAPHRLARLLHRKPSRPVHWQLAVVLAGERVARRGKVGRPGLLLSLLLLWRLIRLKYQR